VRIERKLGEKKEERDPRGERGRTSLKISRRENLDLGRLEV